MKRPGTAKKVAIRNILLPTDFSPQAQVAAGYAKLLAENYGAAIHAVHVVPGELYGALPAENLVIAATWLRCGMHERMHTLDGRLRGVKHDTLVAEGSRWPQLERVMKSQEVDCIVMGSAGLHALERVVLGSLAEGILRRAQCPVLTVGPNSAEANDESFRRILFAIEFDCEERKAAALAVSIAQEYGSELTLTHISQPNRYESGKDYDRANAYRAEQLKHVVPPDVELWCQPEIMLQAGEPASRILKIAERRHIGLIVLGAHKTDHPVAVTHFRDSVAARVIGGARCPVLTVRG